MILKSPIPLWERVRGVGRFAIFDADINITHPSIHFRP